MRLQAKSVVWFGVSMAAAALSAVSLGGCEKAAPAAPMGRPPSPVSVAAAEPRDVPVYLDAIGRIVSTEIVSVIPQVGGRVTKVHIADGADIKRGQLLFEIDNREYQAAVSSAEALLQERQADVELAKLEFKRVEGMIDKAAISQLEFDQKRVAVMTTTAQVAGAEAALETARLNVEYTKILSPIDGRAGAVLVDAGNVVKDNDQSLLTIQKLDPIYAEFTVTENDLGTVRKFIASRGLKFDGDPEMGLTVIVDVPGDSKAIVSALGDPNTTTAPVTQPGQYRAGPREGTLVFLDNTVQDNSGTVKVRALMKNEDRFFWPGQFVKCRVVLMTKKGALLVPTIAQQIGQQGPYVYVVKQSEVTDPATGKKSQASVAELRPITLGQRQGQMVVVEKGLQTGEQVITVGHMMVQPGAAVMIVPEGGPPGAPGGDPKGGPATAPAVATSVEAGK